RALRGYSGRVRFLTFAACIASAAWGQSASVELTMLKSLVLEERVEMVSRKMLERQATLEKLFTDVGCSGEYFTTQKVPGSRSPTLICRLKGTDPGAGVIVVGGHYDFIDAGIGAIDDWSGSVMLPSLYESLKGQPRRHDYVFIAFAAEEKGLVGS